jgi:anti-sigma regulatory factor (Ser/Thr protein kinase)
MNFAARRLSLPARIESIAAFQEFARSNARVAAVAEEEFEKLDLVLEELLINIARYAYNGEPGAAEITVSSEGAQEVLVEISDFGAPFNPLDVDPPDLTADLAHRPIGGLGVFLVRHLVGSMSYRRDANRNVISFSFPARE